MANQLNRAKDRCTILISKVQAFRGFQKSLVSLSMTPPGSEYPRRTPLMRQSETNVLPAVCRLVLRLPAARVGRFKSSLIPCLTQVTFTPPTGRYFRIPLYLTKIVLSQLIRLLLILNPSLRTPATTQHQSSIMESAWPCSRFTEQDPDSTLELRSMPKMYAAQLPNNASSNNRMNKSSLFQSSEPEPFPGTLRGESFQAEFSEYNIHPITSIPSQTNAPPCGQTFPQHRNEHSRKRSRRILQPRPTKLDQATSLGQLEQRWSRCGWESTSVPFPMQMGQDNVKMTYDSLIRENPPQSRLELARETPLLVQGRIH